MVIYLEGEVDEQVGLDEMTPRQIVAELDRYIIGQKEAKKAVAAAKAGVAAIVVLGAVVLVAISGGFRVRLFGVRPMFWSPGVTAASAARPAAPD